MRLFLIRHAQSENNILTMDTLHRRKVDPDLTPLGYQQRDHLSQFIAKQRSASESEFQITQVYTSAMYRSLLTAQPLGAALGLSPRSGRICMRAAACISGATGRSSVMGA